MFLKYLKGDIFNKRTYELSNEGEWSILEAEISRNEALLIENMTEQGRCLQIAIFYTILYISGKVEHVLISNLDAIK
jgi:hypothetical protein